MDQLAFEDATALCQKIRGRDISSVELLDHYIARIERIDGDINAVVVRRFDWARDRTRAADAALARGEDWGPLHGLPMTMKEAFDLAGLPTCWGIPELKDNLPDSDAVVCQRLEDAGAIIFGKTNVPLNLADFQSYNEVYGTTENPYQSGRTPGGSSGGAAAALASGLTALEMGSDIGGSIRNPASYCGVYGLKPSWNIVPPRGHAMPGVLTPTDISVVGPMARSARDLELALGIVAGADELQSPGWDVNLPIPRQQSLQDFRVAVWANDPLAPVAGHIQQRVIDVGRMVEEDGGSVDYEARPAFDAADSHRHYSNLLNATMSARRPRAYFEKFWNRRQQKSSPDHGPEADYARSVTLFYREWHEHNEQRTRLRWAWHDFFTDFDLLLAPVTSTTAFPHDHSEDLIKRVLTVDGESRSYWDQIFWAGISGVSYLPSTVFPTGLAADGLPIGVQAIGPEMGDLTTILFAKLIADQLTAFTPPPTLTGRVGRRVATGPRTLHRPWR